MADRNPTSSPSPSKDSSKKTNPECLALDACSEVRPDSRLSNPEDDGKSKNQSVDEGDNLWSRWSRYTSFSATSTSSLVADLKGTSGSTKKKHHPCDEKLDCPASKMTDKDYAPLSAACVRALNDKMYDKRKAAALEIEKMTRECVQVQNHVQIQKLLKVLGVDFATSHNANMRKGGLIGLAAMAIALNRETERYVKELVSPILICMADTDSRVRFYACESLYSVTKVTRDNILPMFNEIFDCMSSVIADLDQTVRTTAELLDRLLKDIITENVHFDMGSFVPLFKERMYCKNTFTRQFNLSWLNAMHKVPDTTITNYLSELIDPLFDILSDENPEIYVKCERELDRFLRHIEAHPPEDEAFDIIINVLVMHSQEGERIRLQTVAIQWIRILIKISGTKMVPHISGILSAVLPNLGMEEERRRNITEDQYRKIRDESLGLNKDLMKLVGSWASEENFLIEKPQDENEKHHLETVVNVLTGQLRCGRVETKVAALRWIYHLFSIAKPKMVLYVDKLFPVLLKTISDPADEVVILNVQVLAVICARPKGKTCEENKHFQPFVHSLVRLFAADSNLLHTKGSFIVRQLCVLLSAEDIYRTLAQLVYQESDLKFARTMVECLNTILFTSSELFALRVRLKELKTTESCELFTCLYKTWSHSQISTVELCLLSGCYKHALDLVRVISEQEVTIELLLELDRCIQLIESPIFAHLRYELLDNETNDELLRALYGLMNLMPQTKAFVLLNGRLKNLPKIDMAPGGSPRRLKKNGVGHKNVKEIDFIKLMVHFKSVQSLHEQERYDEVSDDIAPRDAKVLDLSDSEDEAVAPSVQHDD